MLLYINYISTYIHIYRRADWMSSGKKIFSTSKVWLGLSDYKDVPDLFKDGHDLFFSKKKTLEHLPKWPGDGCAGQIRLRAALSSRPPPKSGPKVAKSGRHKPNGQVRCLYKKKKILSWPNLMTSYQVRPQTKFDRRDLDLVGWRLGQASDSLT